MKTLPAPFAVFAGSLHQYSRYDINHFMVNYWEGIRAALQDLMAQFPHLWRWSVCPVPAEWGRTLVDRADHQVALPEGSFLRAGAVISHPSSEAINHVVAAPADDSFVIVGAACLPEQSLYQSNRALFGACDWAHLGNQVAE